MRRSSSPFDQTEPECRRPGQLEAARGAIRDALGALRNAEQLLRSIKVGPKALSSVLPSLHASCDPLLQSWRELLEVLAPGTDSCRQRLEAFVVPRIEELAEALGRAVSHPVNARQRLALEQVLSRVASELDTARALVELLEDAQSGALVLVDLRELIRQTFQAAGGLPSGGGENVQATLERGENVELKVSPRATMGLIAIAVRQVAGQSGVRPHLRIHREAGGRCGLVITPGPGVGETLILRPPHLIPPTMDCACAAAQALGACFDFGSDRGAVSLMWQLEE